MAADPAVTAPDTVADPAVNAPAIAPVFAVIAVQFTDPALSAPETDADVDERAATVAVFAVNTLQFDVPDTERLGQVTRPEKSALVPVSGPVKMAAFDRSVFCTFALAHVMVPNSEYTNCTELAVIVLQCV
jgi:hypothetical protein